MPRLIPVTLALVFIAALSRPVQAADPHLTKIVEQYDAIVQSLAKHSIEGFPQRLETMKKAAEELQKNAKLPEEDRKALKAAIDIYSVKDLTQAKLGLHLLTRGVEAFAAKDSSLGLKKVRCQPAPADWLQKDTSKIYNPYLGDAGKDCGQFLDIKSATKPEDMPLIKGDLLPKSDSKPAPDTEAKPSPPADKGK